ncbi:MAG: polysaccharide deacetylase family protein [Fuerstiella sp.]
MIVSRLKSAAVRLSDSEMFAGVLDRLERRSQGRRFLRVLAYHRIDDEHPEDQFYPGLISTTPAGFAAQMECLSARYHVCTMDEVVAAVESRSHDLPPDSVLLTFDDATLDLARHAWPILKSMDLPATVFVPTAYPDQPDRHFWWDRLYRAVMHSRPGTCIPVSDSTSVTLTNREQRLATFRQLKERLKQLPHDRFQILLSRIVQAADVPDPAHNNVLGWPELKRLHTEGLTLAPHTHTHPMLNQLPDAQIREEVDQSLDTLRTQLGSVCPALAYPAGGVSDSAVRECEAAGIKVAFTTARGVNHHSLQQPLRLKRINVGGRTSNALLRLQLANWGR